ncbi:hypothetical protein FQN54_006045 [Arachnomyces sp. PD_36]|nr:hypothetical protein FQN54_006045 [Arachnomyces sp. PD_36]
MLGIVEICPCIRLTWGDKLELLDQLENPGEEASSNESSFWHECVTMGEQGTVLTQAQPVLHDGSLVFEMRYTFTTPIAWAYEANPSFLEDVPVFLCSHVVLTNVFWHAVDAVMYNIDSRVAKGCGGCQTKVTNFATIYAEDGSVRHYFLQSRRNLGGRGEDVGRVWDRQVSPLFCMIGLEEDDILRRGRGPTTKSPKPGTVLALKEDCEDAVSFSQSRSS